MDWFNLVISGISGAFTAVLVQVIWPIIRVWCNTRSIEFERIDRQGDKYAIRIKNSLSFWPLKKCIAYITINNAGQDVHVDSTIPTFVVEGIQIKEDRLCWSYNDEEKNPTEIDIYSGESQRLEFYKIRTLTTGTSPKKYFEFPSEKGWANDVNPNIKSRCLLQAKEYKVHIKIVSASSKEKTFEFKIAESGVLSFIKQKNCLAISG